jgi:hypothetical protein
MSPPKRVGLDANGADKFGPATVDYGETYGDAGALIATCRVSRSAVAA